MAAVTYNVQARSTDTFGRVLVSFRNHHLVVDGPVQNGCPGEATTPVEAFLAGIAACGVELVEVIGRERGLDLAGAACTITGEIDRDAQPRSDHTLFTRVALSFELDGVTDEQGAELLEAFKAR